MSERDVDDSDAAERVLPSIESVRDYVAGQALRPGPIGAVGLELEGHLIDRRDIARRVPWEEIDRLRGLVPDLPNGSLLSVEPGGQLELSTPPVDGIEAAVQALIADHRTLAGILRREGYGLAYLGLDPARPAQRVNPARRYVLMERHFEESGCGTAARKLMSSSAGLQLNLEAGPAADCSERLRRLGRIGPLLLAMSACSRPSPGSGRAGSLRQQAWFELETARTAPVPFGTDPATAWADYALAAPLMLLRGERDTFGEADPAVFGEAPSGLTLADWAADPGRVGRSPTVGDVDYHLTTLFPVIRPRGFLELRFLDASPGRFWPGLAAIVATLIDDPVAAIGADELVGEMDPDWQRAAALGLGDPELGRAASACAELAADRCPDGLRDRATAFADIVSAGLTPGDLLLDEAGGDRWRLLEEALDA